MATGRPILGTDSHRRRTRGVGMLGALADDGAGVGAANSLGL